MRIARQGRTTFAALVCAMAFFSCSDSTSTSALGNVSAQVLDPNNSGVQGVQADLYKLVEGGAILWRASLTSSNGIAVFGASDGGVVVGNYYVHVSFVNNYGLAPGETNDKQVSVGEGEDLVVTFHVIAQGPGAGP